MLLFNAVPGKEFDEVCARLEEPAIARRSGYSNVMSKKLNRIHVDGPANTARRAIGFEFRPQCL